MEMFALQNQTHAAKRLQLPAENFFFLELQTSASDLWCLRTHSLAAKLQQEQILQALTEAPS